MKQTTQLFVKIPKKLLFSKLLTIEECVMYAYLLDKRALSEHTNMQKETFMKFVDEKGIFCLASIDELMNLFDCGKDKVMKMKKNLKELGLIDDKRQIIGSNKIYVYDIAQDIEISNKSENQTFEKL